MYLWIGSEASQACIEAAHRIVDQLKRYEIVPPQFVIVKANEEPEVRIY
jgi:hypothetical protein